MRTLLALITLVVAALAGSAGAVPEPVPASATSTQATFLLTGGGWGHGVGMSQWGAYGQARAGRGYAEILAHYYTGAELGATPPGTPASLRVLVGTGLGSVTVSSSAPLRVRDAGSTTFELPAGSTTITPDLELPVGEGGELQVLAGPLLFLPAKGVTLSFGGREYRANLRVTVVQEKLQVVNVVPLETYLQGVVPGEMPASWPLEALKAQAVAARTYALANLVKGRSYDLFASTRSQVYYGAKVEAATSTRAVRETRGQILLFEGAPISALYSASSGGRTANALDVYGNEVPYLVSVDDPWDAISPHHVWAPRTFTGAVLAKAFGLAAAVVDIRSIRGTAGRPALLSLTTASGGTFEVRVTEVRSRLGLKSSSFRFGTLRLARPLGPRTTPAVTLTGVARDVARPALERLGASGTWVPGPRLSITPDGTFAVTLRAPGPLTVRLVAEGLTGLPLVVPAVGSPS